MDRKPEIYISIDVEADGRVPGLSSMLSFGAAAFSLDKELLGTFSRNLRQIEGAAAEPDSMAFWAENPQAWEAARRDPDNAETAMPAFVAWVAEVGQGYRPPVCVGMPAVYDFKWIDYYCVRFAGTNPFGFNRCLDAKSYAAAYLGGDLRRASRRNFPKAWYDEGLPHTHVALDDAVEQGALVMNMMRAVRGLPPIAGIVRRDAARGPTPSPVPAPAR